MTGTVMNRRGVSGARGVGGASAGRVALLVRLCVLGMVAGVLAGMTLGALVLAVKKAPGGPVRGEDPGCGEGPVPGAGAGTTEPGPDALAVARQLVAARDAVLSAGDTAALSALSVPEGEAAAADATLGSVLDSTPVAQVETEVREASWVGEDLLEVVTVQRRLVLSGGQTMGPQPERCARWQLSPQPWRIVAVRPCS
ncbi:hypothetical protein ACGUFB_02865 [Actinotignum schaalii]|nr:hypothetical protein [Actinotignum schaalii]